MSMKKTDLEKHKGKKLTTGRGRTPDRYGKASSGAPAADGRARTEPLAVRLFRQKPEPK
jgi:hypothetical protein